MGYSIAVKDDNDEAGNSSSTTTTTTTTKWKKRMAKKVYSGNQTRPLTLLGKTTKERESKEEVIEITKHIKIYMVSRTYIPNKPENLLRCNNQSFRNLLLCG
mmetsp:Transcript_43852/g.106331  ORF Transcript_43852/g.106331 Transcript_43852/m.106331 type:complete len:102 (+) Transcript_43852:137-442(+)